MSIQMDPPRSPVPAAAQVLAEAALQRQNMLLGADKVGTGVAAPTPGALPSPTPIPATPLAPPPLPEGVRDPALADRVSLSPRASQALQAQGQGGVAQGNAAPAAPRAAPLPPAAAATLAAAAAGGAEAVEGAAWPAQGVSPAMRGLLQALVQQLAPAAPPRVVVAQPWGPAAGGGVAADVDVPPLQTWLVGQGRVLTEQGERVFSATLRVPAAWLQAQPAAPAAAPPGSASTLQAAFAGRPQALAGGLFALVLQPTVLAGDAHGGAPVGGHTSALLALELAPWAGAAASLVYGREQLHSRNDPWLQMLALQASGYGRDEEEAEQRRRARGHCDTPGCPYAGRAPCEQPFCHAMRVEPVPPIDRA
ncbi:hypothetical protein CLU86_3780 [Acidovorax sp. 62]|uniref:hypothetical protein n=1 Tax=Acidovorax sp. 62 TaxID=2035203 RepID=UPI000C17AD5A|nr:hypothetical protein [Acidovorax sp. 62]PIF92830.1 hypothetical protein CLU86_3780 [Acidovorax sp. 62]